jgi:hypothetical protein
LYVITTDAPATAHVRQIAEPIPPPPPVTSTTLSCKDAVVIVLPPWWARRAELRCTHFPHNVITGSVSGAATRSNSTRTLISIIALTGCRTVVNE